MVLVLDRVLVNHEALIFRRGQLYAESLVPGSLQVAHYRRPSVYAWFLAKNYWLRRGEVRVPSGVWAIDNFSPANYYHWMVDVLPRLVRAQERFPDVRTLLLPRSYRQQAYVTWTLAAFASAERVGWIGDRAKARVERLVWVPRQDLRLGELLREVARRVATLAGAPGPARRVYFSRDDAQWRRARNERELVRLLVQHGFEIHRLEAGRPWDHVRAAAGADIVVGVHGAALTNLIFMPLGGRVLELRHRHDDMFFDHYRPIAEMVGVEYRRQECEPADSVVGWEINNADLIVDLDVLRTNLHDLDR